ncbi:transmembrane protein 62-like [Aphidius gifuensis]|uniref:transmembrane protein 62-like n=1 Tax=Aphidius gifuensis TaxID=684658 RepID=UPI001CDD4336|nr:transmembrane protein 62-like [Aphidius gifuensis]
MTDGKTRGWGGSKQNLQEWKKYKEVLDESGITTGDIPWLDIRGNHDNFNIISIDSPENHYLNYSIQGQKKARSFIHQMTVRSTNYSFIAVDACMTPGPRRPFDFFGHLDKTEIQHITKFIEKSKQSKSDYNIWFGHFPTSCIITDDEKDVKQIIGKDEKSVAYLCGHLHTFAGLSPNMYTIQNEGYLEIEVSDWKEHRIFRLGVIDNGLFTFVDVKHDEWPIGIITNPKNALYHMKKKENIQSIVDSTHIRVLAFSLDPVVNVSIQINNGKWINCYKVGDDPLWVTEWNSSLYKIATNSIRAKIIDKMGRTKETELQYFSLDGTQPSFSFISTVILNTETKTFVLITIIFYAFMSIIIIVPLCICKYLHGLCQKKQRDNPRIRRKWIRSCVRKIWLLSTLDFIFYPIIIYPIYLAIGPWIAGEIIEDKYVSISYIKCAGSVWTPS